MGHKYERVSGSDGGGQQAVHQSSQHFYMNMNVDIMMEISKQAKVGFLS